jgi:hypothetical protein
MHTCLQEVLQQQLCPLSSPAGFLALHAGEEAEAGMLVNKHAANLHHPPPAQLHL